MAVFPALGHARAFTGVLEVSSPGPAQPVSAVTDGWYEYEYVSVDCMTTNDVLSHNSSGKLAGNAAPALANGDVVHTKYDVVT